MLNPTLVIFRDPSPPPILSALRDVDSPSPVSPADGVLLELIQPTRPLTNRPRHVQNCSGDCHLTLPNDVACTPFFKPKIRVNRPERNVLSPDHE